MTPLQTHGQYTVHWVPPKPDRFTVYEASDEGWARPLGLGSVERRLLALFDVRDEHGDLVGYTKHCPHSYYVAGKCAIRIGVLEATEHIGYSLAQTWADTFTDNSICQIREIRVELQEYEYQCAYERQRFVGWRVRLHDAAALLEGGWMTCIGSDHKGRYVAELRRRAFEKDVETKFGRRRHQ